MPDDGDLLAIGTVGDTLTLTHVSLRHATWELTVEDGVVARLRDEFRGGATGEVASGSYALSRMDRHGDFEIATAAGQRVASFHIGRAQIPGHLPSDRYNVIFVGAMPTEFSASWGNTTLIKLVQNTTWTGRRATVTITPAGRNDAHLEPLLLLLCHAWASNGDIGIQNHGGFIGSGTFDEPAPL